MRIYENMKFLCKIKGVPLGNIEEACGVQIGFFSRYKDKQEKIPCGFIVTASKMLDTPIEWLMFTPMADNHRRNELEAEIKKLQEELADLEVESE